MKFLTGERLKVKGVIGSLLGGGSTDEVYDVIPTGTPFMSTSFHFVSMKSRGCKWYVHCYLGKLHFSRRNLGRTEFIWVVTIGVDWG